MKKEVHWHLRYSTKRRVIIGITILIVTLFYLFRDASYILRGLSASGVIILFYLVDHYFDVRFRREHYAFIVFIAFFSFLLSPLYYIYPNYDKLLHFLQPVLFSSIVFYMMKPLKVATKWKIIFTFFVVMGVVGLHEVGEYALDHLFDLKLQGVFLRDIGGLEKYNLIQSRIDDTMIDMSLGVVGAFVYAMYKAMGSYMIHRYRKKSKITP